MTINRVKINIRNDGSASQAIREGRVPIYPEVDLYQDEVYLTRLDGRCLLIMDALWEQPNSRYAKGDLSIYEVIGFDIHTSINFNGLVIGIQDTTSWNILENLESYLMEALL